MTTNMRYKGKVIKDFNDIVNKEFIYLKVVKYEYSEPNKNGVGNHHYYKCLCKCGKEVITKRRSLLKNEIKSCGCYTIEINKQAGYNKRIYKDEESRNYNHLYRRHLNQAKYRNLEFKLTREEHKILVSNDCHYCGSKPSNTLNEKWMNTSLNYSGIDRKYQNTGYTKDNCVSCCIICNKAKNTLDYDEFKSYISKLINFNK